MGYDNSDYVEVADRIQQLFTKYPDASIQTSFEGFQEVAGKQFLIVKATVWRTPEDPRPAMDYAWEAVPGSTPFTRGSELMVGSTSAVGRAIAMLGIATKKSIATKHEIMAAKARNTPVSPTEAPQATQAPVEVLEDPWGEKQPTVPGNRVGVSFSADLMSEPQRKAIYAICKTDTEVVVANFKKAENIPAENKLSKKQASKLIENLKTNGAMIYLGSE
jgi:hypothetical protein